MTESAADLAGDLDRDLAPPPSEGAQTSLRASGPIKLRYSHQAMIDLIIANPGISQNEIAAQFGYSAPWVSQIILSDAFQAQLAARREELVDPTLVATIKQQFEGLVARSLEIMRRKLAREPENVPDQLVVQALKVSATALGYGARNVEAQAPPVNVEVHLHSLGANLEKLLAQKRGQTIDVAPSAPQETPSAQVPAV